MSFPVSLNVSSLRKNIDADVRCQTQRDVSILTAMRTAVIACQLIIKLLFVSMLGGVIII